MIPISGIPYFWVVKCKTIIFHLFLSHQKQNAVARRRMIFFLLNKRIPISQTIKAKGS